IVENKAQGAGCDDGEPSTKVDLCDGQGGCAGTSYTCEPTQCEASSAPDGEGCVGEPAAQGLDCDDGDLGTADDVCDGAGGCGGTPYACEPTQCEASSVPDGEGCIIENKAPGVGCDDGSPDTKVDICDGDGGCSGTPYVCELGSCEVGSVPNGSDCDVEYEPAGESCDDGDPGTIDDACDGGPGCVGTPTVCGDEFTQGLEACDDGNTVTEPCAYGELACEVCDATCALVAGEVVGYCGDGVTQEGFGEECDDGDNAGGDGCAADCTSESGFPDCEATLAAVPGLGDGVYSIDPDGAGGQEAFDVHCDMTTDGGGWTLVANISDAGDDVWSQFMPTQSAGLWDTGATLGGAPTFTADYKSQAYLDVASTSLLIKEGGGNNVLQANSCWPSGSFHSFISGLTWNADGSDFNWSDGSGAHLCNFEHFGYNDPVLRASQHSGSERVVAFKWGERDGVQDGNKDRTMIT
ncbi:MAG: fibrinogen-like YCDxxxxGGGW domain-containing protein, partial [Myxococcota bacterium]|nr:fibrinogen-like YCDxxxxGGGW domain-containing protein [Myxococcota bacterium]